MTEASSDVLGWNSWVQARSRISSQLSNADRSNSRTYFVDVHAASEEMFRRVILIGLRVNRVTYDEANEWLFHNDETPDKDKYPKIFDALYKTKGIAWESCLRSVDGLGTSWSLWLNFAKVIRNHLLHGIRSYEPEWYECAIRVNQELIVRFDLALSMVVGGSPVGSLNDLSPRLPRGKSGQVIHELVGRKKSREPRPRISLEVASEDLKSLDSKKVWQ